MTFDDSGEQKNIQFTQGDDKTFNIERLQEDGTPFDIDGWTFWLTIKSDKYAPDSDAEVQETATSHTNPSAGKTRIQLSADDTKPLAGSYYYELQQETDTGTIQTLLYGTMYFRNEITEAPTP